MVKIITKNRLEINPRETCRTPFTSAGATDQRGIASILLVVLVGMAMTATALTMVGQVHFARELQVAGHAATHSQNALWFGVESFRQYLNALTQEQVRNLTGNLQIEVEDAYGVLYAQNIQVDQTQTPWRVTADIINYHTAAKSSSAVQVVFALGGGACTNCIMTLPGLDFYDDLDANGGIEFITPGGVLPRINVDGNINMGGLSISHIGDLNATGSVRLHSNVQVDRIYANDDVTIDGGVFVAEIRTLGKVTTLGGAGAGSVWANLDADMGGSVAAEYVNALGTITLTVGDYGQVKGAAGVRIPSTAVLVVDAIESEGNVWLDQTSLTVGTVKTEAGVFCPAADGNWDKFDSIIIKGAVRRSCSGASATAKITTDSTLDLTMMTALEPFTMPPLLIDTWALKPAANYQFEYDALASRMKVTVNNINGVTNGSEYYIGNYSDNRFNSYLCTEVNAYGQCTLPTTPLFPVCHGFSMYNGCISYDVLTATWQLQGTSTAPGILWFDGNVQLSTGVNYATVLATGNVATSGNLILQAVNYAGYEGVCLASGEGIVNLEQKTIFTSRFVDRYPTNLCNNVDGVYKSIPTGNIGIAAGGFNPGSTGNVFSGGDIEMGALNVVYGSVLAGGRLKTAGDTTIYGFIAAAVQERAITGRPLTKNDLSGSTTVDLTMKTDNFDPSKVPSMTDEPCVEDCDVDTSADNEETSLLWSRYL